MSHSGASGDPFTSGDLTATSGLYKGIGVSLAVASGIFIGASFVFKKKGLVQSVERTGGVAGDGYAYLTSCMWWTGMVLMAIGELCNFAAYAFTQAILVTSLGALSVVISTILSSIFLKERLSFIGKIGCFQCIVGSVIIVLHAPESATADNSIRTFQEHVLAVALVLIFYAAPRWGKTNIFVYVTICSVIGAISVVFTQGLGMAIVYSITKENQFTYYFTYIVLLIVVVTLVIEIVYLNKALNLFNTSIVTPTYYVMFTTLTIVSSIVLFQGFNSSPEEIVTVIQGFFCICSGVALLQIGHQKEETLQEKKPVSEKAIMEPGPAELFPFGGITRFASTTRRQKESSVSIKPSALAHGRQRPVTIAGATASSDSPIVVIDSGNGPDEKQAFGVSNTIGIGNTGPGEDAYSREVRWKERVPRPPAARKQPAVDHRHQKIEAAARQIAINVQEPSVPPSQLSGSPASSFSSDRPIRNKFLRGVPFRSRSRRAQDQLNRFRAYNIGVHQPQSDDRRHLMPPQDSVSMY
ncbi:magnesium transporter NIPA-domain-containing protein [Fennellomyces sp. T-0311]|nr:magnesium transporter NIPA-domain-containing protein [Fennellomyces sp. T-0311]